MKALSLAIALLFLSPLPTFGFGGKPANPAPSPSPSPTPAPAPAPPPSPTPAPSGGIPTPTAGSDFLACNSRISGTWDFGSAPSGCSVSPAQSQAYAAAQYSPVVFHDGAANAHRAYMSEQFAFARAVGTYYIRRRNPQVSNAELEGFLAGFFTLLNQESFWTHYRLGTDKVLRYMRGDSLHGFGIMQVDDRSHSVALNQGKGVDLAENMIYGLDIYYAAWVRSASASCVSSAGAYEQRARAAWSAYNGGPSQLCRWTNASSQWAAQDNAYADKFRNRAWLGDVADTNATTRLDAACLAEGKRPCAFK